jgi:WD40 repeat protein
MWNIESTQLIKRYRRDKLERTCFCLVAGVNHEYIIGGDGPNISVWDRESGTCVKKFIGHEDNIHGLVVSPRDPFQLVSFSIDGSIHVYALFH